MTKTPETTMRIFKEHIHYEIGRLVDMYLLLLKPEYAADLTAQIAKTLEDALIVGYCTHARNLLEFFYRQSGKDEPASVNYAHAPPYEPLNRYRKDVDALLNKLNNQINHISYERKEETSEKIHAARAQADYRPHLFRSCPLTRPP